MGKICGFIFARGGSKGVPRKNLRIVGGKSLIEHAALAAKKSALISNLVLSSEDHEILTHGQLVGINTCIKRPDELSTDTASELDAWKHAAQYMKENFAYSDADIFVSVPATSPLRQSQDIDNAIQVYMDTGSDIVLSISESQRNPYFNMVQIQDDEGLSLVCQGHKTIRRQDAKPVFDITTVCYVSSFGYIRETEGLLSGHVGYSKVPPSRALDIDSEFDLHLADLLLRNPFGENNDA
ncbi:MAG: acylneuraminate cytidylyltransferase family protein [Alphaproteobacteria bacterium]|nr:acylneuraminate cytidylyltransferase family protein [Alphaproteobacteria bacterium]